MACTKAPADYAKKKSPLYKERDEVKRQSFLLNLSQHAINKCVYIDESGIDKFISREHGWGERGQRVIGEISGRRYARESFIAGLVSNQVVAPLCYTGTCDTILFNFWLENFLLPELGLDIPLLWITLRFISQKKLKAWLVMLTAIYYFYLRTPQISIPLQNFGLIIKNKIKKIISNFNSLAEVVDYAFRSII